MKNYLIEIKDGHHHVRMLTDAEMDLISRAVEMFTDIFERVRSVVKQVVDNLYDFIEQLPEEKKEELLNEHTTHESGY